MKEETGITPEALARRPTLDKIWSWPYSVWSDLSTGKSQPEVPQKFVTFTETFLYAVTYGLTKEELGDLWHDIQVIDKVWSSDATKIAEKQATVVSSQSKMSKHLPNS